MAEIPDINQYIGSDSISSARDSSNEAAQRAVNYQSAAGQLPSKLRRAVQESVDFNKDIIEAQNSAAADYFAAPSQAREKFQGIFNPFEREKLVTEFRGQQYQPYANLTDILGERRGDINDIVQSGVGAFQSSVAAQQGAAGIARQNYSDLLNQGQLQYQGAQYDYEAQIAAQKAAKGDGTGSNNSYVNKLLETLGLGEDPASSFVEPQPKYLVKEGSMSTFGQWKLSNDGWDIVVD